MLKKGDSIVDVRKKEIGIGTVVDTNFGGHLDSYTVHWANGDISHGYGAYWKLREVNKGNPEWATLWENCNE